MSELEPIWESVFRDMPIRLTWPDITLHRMLEMQQAFGTEFGIPAEFILLLARGDMRALACAVWIGQQQAGGKVDKLGELDFSPADFSAPEKPKRARKAKADPPTEGDLPQSGSLSTVSESSGAAISSISLTSAG